METTPANVFNYHYEDTRLDGSMLITGLYSHGNQIYAEVWNYDNWIIDFTDLISVTPTEILRLTKMTRRL